MYFTLKKLTKTVLIFTCFFSIAVASILLQTGQVAASCLVWILSAVYGIQNGTVQFVFKLRET